MGVLTTVSVTKATRERLKDFGSKGDSYDDILNRLMQVAEENEFFERQARILKRSSFKPLDDL